MWHQDARKPSNHSLSRSHLCYYVHWLNIILVDLRGPRRGGGLGAGRCSGRVRLCCVMLWAGEEAFSFFERGRARFSLERFNKLFLRFAIFAEDSPGRFAVRTGAKNSAARASEYL